MEAIRTYKQGNYIVETFYDSCPDNPRHYQDLTKLILFHRRYNLGDEHDYKQSDYSNWGQMEADIIAREKPGLIYPVYMYEHGAVSLSTSSFNDRWDSGQVGFVTIDWKTFQSMTTDEAVSRIEEELKQYSSFLNGECYMYRISEEQICNLGCAHQSFVDAGHGYFCEDDCFEEGVTQLNYYISREEVPA